MSGASARFQPGLPPAEPLAPFHRFAHFTRGIAHPQRNGAVHGASRPALREMKATTLTQFSDLGLNASILKTLEAEGYDRPTPIQSQAIPKILSGHDLLGIAQTGTGKTAAFALPILNRLAETPKPPMRKACRVLILSPTRELATQIAESFRTYGAGLKLSVLVCFGGVPVGGQIRALAFGVDILVATPGRLLDHVQTNSVRLDQVETFVLDEADQMLDMGFILPIRRLVKTLPARRQNLFFSATMPGEIGALAGELLRNPEHVAVTPVATPVELIDQQVIYIENNDKRALLTKLLREGNFARTLVFTRTKHGADRVVRHLDDMGMNAAAIHGNKSQAQRERALAGFKSGHIPILVATDIAARGIDVDGVSHVINFDLPNIPDSYVHRIGRTARAGASGIAISFCAGDERAYLRDIEHLIRKRLPSTDERGRMTEKRPERPQGERPQGERPQGEHRADHRSPRPHQGRPNHSHGGPGGAKPGHKPLAAGGGHGPKLRPAVSGEAKRTDHVRSDAGPRREAEQNGRPARHGRRRMA